MFEEFLVLGKVLVLFPGDHGGAGDGEEAVADWGFEGELYRFGCIIVGDSEG